MLKKILKKILPESAIGKLAKVKIKYVDSSLTDIHASQIYKFVTTAGYEIYAKAVNTVIFKHKGVI